MLTLETIFGLFESTIYLLAGTGLRKLSSAACGFSSIKIFSDYPKSLIEVYASLITVWFATIILVVVFGMVL